MDTPPAPCRLKRKADANYADDTATVLKKPRGKGKAKQVQSPIWPDYFDSLFKVYKALNTVLAFCSSRKHIATTFPAVRTSVEGLLKGPLELTKVAELKALLPDLITFAYTPKNDIRVNGDSPAKGRDLPSFDISPESTPSQKPEDEEHVLLLEFSENSKGKKSVNIKGSSLSMPAALSPVAMKKLIERRNLSFSQAVDELLAATPETEDPVALIQEAAIEHVPINPSAQSFSSSSLVPFADPPGHVRTLVPDHKDRNSIDSTIAEIKQQLWYKEQIVDERTFDAKEGDTKATLGFPLSLSIREALNSRGIGSLYTHQTAAINSLTDGQNVIVSTSTASGKSVIYQVPLLKFLEDDGNATAIFIYPTKALAQDQRSALSQLMLMCPGLQHIKVATYDGDTPTDERAGIRDAASVIFTNFDMIHSSILPHEDLWRRLKLQYFYLLDSAPSSFLLRFLQNVRLVAVDELHCYSGIFGSHVAQIIRRFRRVCAAVGNPRPCFVSCSATISRPREHMQNLFGIADVVEITEDGAPSGRKSFLVWDPQPFSPGQPNLGRPSAISEATGLMRFLMKRGIRVILFCKIRKACEMAMKIIRADLLSEGRDDILQKTMPYRGGYSQQDRRHIEAEAFCGNLLGIIATNALELGVDIGILDAVIMLGFPLSIASFRQQAGRAGRRALDSLAVLVADSSPLDQHFVKNPDELFESFTDELVLDLDNALILEGHLQCAAHEIPLSMEDESYFGSSTKQILSTKLATNGDGWYHTHNKFLPFPAKYISIRGVQEEKYSVVDTTASKYHIIEEIEISRALFEIYEGGVWIHQGFTYVVKEVSHDSRMAKVIRADVNWVTMPRDFTDVDAVETLRIRALKESPHRAYYGHVEVETRVFGFFKTRHNVILDTVDVDTPPWHRDTTGLWIDVPRPTLDSLCIKGISPAEAIHSASHAFMNVFALAARGDMKTECKAAEKEYAKRESARKRPARLIFHDSPGKSGGVAAKAFDNVYDLLAKALESIKSCPCDEGCVKCVQSPACSENNAVSSKIGAMLVVSGVLAIPVDMDSIETQQTAGNFDTILEAQPVRTVKDVVVES